MSPNRTCCCSPLSPMLSRFRKDSSQSGYTFYYEENKNPVLLVSTDINIYNIIYNVNVNNVKTIIRSR